MKCNCYWCLEGLEHPSTQAHQVFHRISDRLLVADSLREEDRIPTEACTICGHMQPIEPKSGT